MNAKICPNCTSRNTENTDIYVADDNGNSVEGYFACNNCGISWRAVYDIRCISNMYNIDGEQLQIEDADNETIHIMGIDEDEGDSDINDK